MTVSNEENVNSNKTNGNVKNKETKSDANFVTDEGKWGYDLYPERKGEKLERKLWKVFVGLQGREEYDRNKCEKNVYEVLQTSPLVKLLMGALKSSGCEVNIRRHICCEVCKASVSGGYDAELNQIVICQNTTPKARMHGVLTHEMIHMFDYCRNNLDFKNLEHLACTEIRAANLTHCSFMSGIVDGSLSPFRIKKAHQECVKAKAIASVVAARSVSEERAKEVVDRVFDRCYKDLEPIGRRIRRNSPDKQRAYNEAYLYGYDV